MSKTIIKVACVDQRLVVVDSPLVASGGVNEDVIQFEFCPLWANCEKVAIFYRNKEEAYQVAITDDQCMIPHEVLRDEGILYFGVIGIDGDVIRTSEVLKYTIAEGAVTDATTPADPTPDIYAQYIALYQTLERRVTNLEVNGGGGGEGGGSGFSPTIEVTEISGGHRLEITDITGTTSVDVMDGKDGATGPAGSNGKDGKTPVKGTDYYTAADKDEMKQDILNDIDTSVYVTGSVELEIATGKLVANENGVVVIKNNSNGRYGRCNVEGHASITATGYQWDASYGYYLLMFTKGDGTIIGRHAPSGTSVSAALTVDVPDGAVYAYITGHMSNGSLSATGTRRIDVASLERYKANRIAKWDILQGSVKEGYVLGGSTGKSEATNPNGRLATYDVSGLKRVRVTAWQYSIEYTYAACYFYDANGTYISKYFGSAENTKYYAELDVPENAATLKINGHKYNANPEVSGYRTYDVEDLYNDLRPQGKKLITLGDSITALGTGQTGWVKYFLERTGCELVANVAVNGAWLHDKDGTVYDGNPVFEGADNNVNNVLGNQVQKLMNGSYDAPDIIMIAIGTNSGISITKDQIKAAYYDSAGTLIPLANVNRKTSAGAYRWCNEQLQTLYPNAIIFWCTPIMGYQATRSAENAMAYAESLRIATEYSGQIMIDTIRCGISGVFEAKSANGRYLIDGLHPNENGARKIGYYNAAKVMPHLGDAFALKT